MSAIWRLAPRFTGGHGSFWGTMIRLQGLELILKPGKLLLHLAAILLSLVAVIHGLLLIFYLRCATPWLLRAALIEGGMASGLGIELHWQTSLSIILRFVDRCNVVAMQRLQGSADGF